MRTAAVVPLTICLSIGFGTSLARGQSESEPTPEPQIPVEEAQEPDCGRLVITTDLEARIIIDGIDVGTLEPETELVHEVCREKGTLRAEAVEASAARVEKSYAFETVSEDETAGEDEPTRVDELELQIKIAKTVRELRKKERREGVYPDFDRGLMWRRGDNGANLTWKEATRYCAELSFGGWSDWRLPSLDELDELQAMWSRAAFKTIDPIALTSCCPWSSSETNESSAWNYNFRFRQAFEGRKALSFGLRALCVRSLTAAELEEREQVLAERKKKKKKKKGAVDEGDAPIGTVEDVSGTARPDDIQ